MTIIRGWIVGKNWWCMGLDVERDPGLSASMHKLLSAYEDNLQIKELRKAIKIRLDSIGIDRMPERKDVCLMMKTKM